jgi:hypothetical protein
VMCNGTGLQGTHRRLRDPQLLARDSRTGVSGCLGIADPP